MTEPPADDEPFPTDEQEAGGAPACALHRVCDACGALEDGPATSVCGRCGTARVR